MKLLTVVEVYFPVDEARDRFTQRFGAYQEGRLTRFVFPDRSEATRAIDVLRSDQVDHAIFFRFELARGELRRYPAVFLGLASLDAVTDGTVNTSACQQSDLFSDYRTGLPYASVNARLVLEPLAHSAQFHKVASADGSRWFQMEIKARLSDPVRVIGAREIVADEEPPHRLSVRGDGRSVVSRSDADLLRREGIAIADRCQLDSAVHQWHPRTLCNGLVFSTLVDHQIQGLLQPPAIALVEGSPLVIGRDPFDIDQ
jgi:hypothetical protein